MENTRLRDFIDFAIQKEIEAAEFYEHNAAVAVMPSSKKLFAELAQTERGHEVKLRSFLKTGKVESFLARTVTDLKISDFLVDVQLRPDSPVQDILIAAAKKEQKAVELYRKLASLEDDLVTRSFFLELAEAEMVHKFDLEKEYDKVVLGDN